LYGLSEDDENEEDGDVLELHANEAEDDLLRSDSSSDADLDEAAARVEGD
jgi:hypothetical protein